jgi:DNA-damage-inducible protein J
MPKSAMVRARVEPNLKEDAERLFEQLGLSATQAITLFYRQVALRRGLPFDVAIPNATTQRTLDATDRGENLTLCKDANDMFKRLGI